MSNKSIDVALKQAEEINTKEGQYASRKQPKLKLADSDFGHADGLRHRVLSSVLAEQYPRAIEVLKEYAEAKSEYPMFKQRAERYLSYSVDLINGIKAKRSFPGINMLAMAKQQELFDKAMRHLDDLKVTLKKIESIEQEVRLEDVRSTVWVVKAGIYCLFAFLVLAFMREISRGVFPAIGALSEAYSNDATDWIFSLFGL